MLDRKVLAIAIIVALFLRFAFFLARSTPVPKMTTADAVDSVRIVIVSDTHRSYRHPIPSGDVWIHAGDSELTASEMDALAKSLPHPHKVVVCGNMDRRLENEKQSLRNVVYLQDSDVTVSGLKIYGSPWTPEFVGIFQLEDSQAATSVWEKVPSDVDVLITHGPPKGILDRTSRGWRVGDGALLDKVEEIKPRVHCFGHIHASYGTMKNGETIFCNAAVFDGHPPLVVDVPLDRDYPASLV